MNLTTGVWMSFLSLVAATPRLICPTGPIEAREGDAVQLQCRLDPWVNLQTYTVTFTRSDQREVVNMRRHGKDYTDGQMEQYRGRTTLIHEDLITGDLTLRISPVQMSDSGQYRCFVPKLKASCTTTVNVVEKDQQTRTKTDDLMSTTEPNDPDAEQVNVGAVVGSVVGVVLAVLAVLIVLGVLVQRGWSQIHKEMHRRGHEAEMMPKSSEMETLGSEAAEEDEEPHSTSENSQRNL